MDNVTTESHQIDYNRSFTLGVAKNVYKCPVGKNK